MHVGKDLVGYIELGKDIEDILDTLTLHPGVQLGVLIRKETLNQAEWENNQRALGRNPKWDQLPNSVMFYNNTGPLPNASALWADQNFNQANLPIGASQELAAEGKEMYISALPLQDAAGREFGQLMVMLDITAEKVNLTRQMMLGGSAGGVLLLVLSIVYVLLYRTEEVIRFSR